MSDARTTSPVPSVPSATGPPLPAAELTGPPDLVPREMSFDDLCAAATQTASPWLWQGYVARGNVTLLTSQWKSGKTTLVAVLLARLKAGGELAGLKVVAGQAAVVSEEPAAHWVARGAKLDLAGHVCWFCRPFASKPGPEQWLALLDRLLALHAQRGLDLVVIDSLATFLPTRDESHAASMLEALLPLQRLTARGLAVLVLHHPRKGEALAGQAARGSGALSGYVDILIEMGWYHRGATEDRRRRLQAWSRHDETPRQLVLELDATGTTYLTHGDFAEEAYRRSWELLRHVLAEAPGIVTHAEILAAWPSGEAKPSEATLWRWLERALADGRVRRDGAGRRNAPYCYWLTERDEEIQRDPYGFGEVPLPYAK